MRNLICTINKSFSVYSVLSIYIFGLAVGEECKGAYYHSAQERKKVTLHACLSFKILSCAICFGDLGFSKVFGLSYKICWKHSSSFFDTSTLGWDFFEILFQVKSGIVVKFCSTFDHFLGLRCATYVLGLKAMKLHSFVQS